MLFSGVGVEHYGQGSGTALHIKQSHPTGTFAAMSPDFIFGQNSTAWLD